MATVSSPIRLAGSSHVFSSPPAPRRAMARLYITLLPLRPYPYPIDVISGESLSDKLKAEFVNGSHSHRQVVMLEVHDLAVNYRNTWAISGVSFSIQP
ncbi:MAG: hypothetical protein RLP02_04835, partial [Coleofasciculus sp. C2-GNP5-27]